MFRVSFATARSKSSNALASSPKHTYTRARLLYKWERRTLLSPNAPSAPTVPEVTAPREVGGGGLLAVLTPPPPPLNAFPLALILSRPSCWLVRTSLSLKLMAAEKSCSFGVDGVVCEGHVDSIGNSSNHLDQCSVPLSALYLRTQSCIELLRGRKLYDTASFSLAT